MKNPKQPQFEERTKFAKAIEKIIRPVDTLFDRIYTWRFNPLYQSGVLAVGLLFVVIATGCYLVFFYKVSAPYESIARVQSQVWTGRWIRSLHRYASDAAMVAIFFHALRMFFQGRSWGPRMLAWVSGLVLTGFMLFCGWTGLILVWDVQGQMIAVEGAKLFDLFPFFAEPLQRAFVSPDVMPSSFFFLNLFIHVAIPLGMSLLLWLHTSRVARPLIIPSKQIFWGSVVALLLLAWFAPAPLSRSADLLALPGRYPINWFYGFWLPVAQALGPVGHLSFWIASAGLTLLVPWIFRPAATLRPKPSFVHEKSCTGCTSCYNDCPFDAISMVDRTVGRGSKKVAHVNPDHCVSCGICSASCDPMGVGPPDRIGREQLKNVEAFIKRHHPKPSQAVVIGCLHGIDEHPTIASNPRALFYPVTCSGALHTTVIEYLIRSGFGGVFVMTCPPRNCFHREGPKWLMQRLYEGHESNLRETVDRRRLRVGHYSFLESKQAVSDLTLFLRDLDDLSLQIRREKELELARECLEKEVADA